MTPEKERNRIDKSPKANRTKSPNSSIVGSGRKCERAEAKDKVPVIQKFLEKGNRRSIFYKQFIA